MVSTGVGGGSERHEGAVASMQRIVDALPSCMLALVAGGDSRVGEGVGPGVPHHSMATAVNVCDASASPQRAQTDFVDRGVFRTYRMPLCSTRLASYRNPSIAIADVMGIGSVAGSTSRREGLAVLL